MKKLTTRKKILSGILLFCILCIFSIVIYRIYALIDAKICYSRISKDFEVGPTPHEIWEAYDRLLNETLANGMSHEQVISQLEKISSVHISHFGDLSNGLYIERTRLRICSVFENDVQFLFRYTKDNLLDSFYLYNSDW